MSTSPAAKFFVNQGVVATATDMLHLLRPLLKQTVTYRSVSYTHLTLPTIYSV